MTLLHLLIIVAILSAGVVLALTNPTMEDYLAFVERELGRTLDRMDHASSDREKAFIRELLRTNGKKLIEGTVRPNTVRRNWGVASRFETDVLDVRMVVLGVGGRFIPIKGVEEATLRVGRLAF